MPPQEFFQFGFYSNKILAGEDRRLKNLEKLRQNRYDYVFYFLVSSFLLSVFCVRFLTGLYRRVE